MFIKKSVASLEKETAQVESARAVYLSLNATKDALEAQISGLESRIAPMADRIAELAERLTTAGSPEIYQAVAAELTAGMMERDAIAGTVKNLRGKMVALEQEEQSARTVWRTSQATLAGAKAKALITPELMEQVATAHTLLIEANSIDRYSPLPDWLRVTIPAPVAAPVIEVTAPVDPYAASRHGHLPAPR